ncbi:MAG: hypothetical protein AUJ07_07260 [Crenarchaeota archaeon 13_1_40CM_3_53_5]|nr:MAG: hypothetical protein AUJ07_07260 [Crenarchaeota archaeon 13_1_40CM_3_53_5]
MTTVAETYGLATGYAKGTGATDSAGNYAALAGGKTFGITDGCCSYFSIPSNNPTIIDRLEAGGWTWKAYAEDGTSSGTCSFNPGNAVTGLGRGADHFGFLHFASLGTPARCTNFVSTASSSDSEFLSALSDYTTAPNYLWLTPNDCNNMHSNSHCTNGCTTSSSSICITDGDNYLSNLIPQILSSSAFLNRRAALFVVFDEDSGGAGAPDIYASFSGPVVKAGYATSTSFTHYSYLKMLESNWGLQCLVIGNDCRSDLADMSEFFYQFNGNFGSCNVTWSCGNTVGLSGTTATIDSQMFHSNLFATGVGDSTHLQLATTRLGTFPPTGQCPHTTPAPSSYLTGAQVSAIFDPFLLPSNFASGQYYIFLALYYYLPDNPSGTQGTNSSIGTRTYQWLDTQVRIQNINGTFRNVGNNEVYDPCNAFGWDNVTIGSASVHTFNALVGNVANQCQNALKYWQISPSTTCRLAGIEIGVKGYRFSGLSPVLSVLWPNQARFTACHAFNGDYDESARIDIVDVGHIAIVYGSSVGTPKTPTSAKYDVNADIAGPSTSPMQDGSINILDIAKAALYFGLVC